MSVLAEAGQTLRPRGDDRHGPLPPILLALTLVTGIVDAASYLRLGHVFVANMTGNIVFLGFALAGAHAVSVASSLTALAAFLVGAFLGGLLSARTPSHRGHMLRSAAALQVVLIAVAVAIAAGASSPPHGATRYALLVPMALAMGVQNAAAQRLAVPELTTTVLTRTLTGIASEGSLAGGKGAHFGRRALAVAAMLLGALAGGLMVLHVSVAAALALAGAIVLAAGLVVHSLSSTEAAWTRP